MNMKYMFGGAKSFNGDLSAWNISSVTEMDWMFDGATSFNQNLCAWKDMFPYASRVDDIFTDSGCTYPYDPEEDWKGTFCASDCEGPIMSEINAAADGDTPAITPRTSGAIYYCGSIFTAAISNHMLLPVVYVFMARDDIVDR